MQVVKAGSRSRAVVLLQVALNSQNSGTGVSLLEVDGVFGEKTTNAVREFQRRSGLTPDGVAGLETWKRALAPAPRVIDAELKKFAGRLGAADAFVAHVAAVEGRHASTSKVYAELSTFTQCVSGARYLLLKKDPYVIDFRHFFAAAAESAAASLSKGTLPLGGTRGDTLLLGVLNELKQCLGEGLQSQMQSCFSREDLGSNRLGAEFGRRLKIATAERRNSKISAQLSMFLAGLEPQEPKAISQAAMPGSLHVAREGFVAIVITIIDALIPDAY